MKFRFQLPKPLSKAEKNADEGSGALTPDGTLCIDCGGCERRPEPSRSECVRCVQAAVSRYGRQDRILLRSTSDIEVSGPGAELLCGLQPMFPEIPPLPGRCQNCECSPRALLAPVWDAFPEIVFDDMRQRLAHGVPKDDSCRSCMQRSGMILDNAEAAYAGTAQSAASFMEGQA